ncbi:MAG: hypothetical protein Q8S20_11125 [Sulfuritalea sp.]|nr:hypothetical protein [Sulfuritalea sp.]
MSNAVERLAVQLMKLSNDEWARATERWIAGQDWNGVFGPAWDEISEQLTEIDREAFDRLR